MLRSPALPYALGAVFVAAGLAHFAVPRVFERIVPPPFDPQAATLWSGVAEVAGGVGLLHPRTRRAASWGLVALLAAVFPANLHMARHPEITPALSPWMLWARLPVQPLLMAVALRAGRIVTRTANR